MAWKQKHKKATWKSSTGMRQTKLLNLSYKIMPLNGVLNMDRNVLRSLTWYLTGHGPFNGHLNNIGKSITHRCRFCGTEK